MSILSAVTVALLLAAEPTTIAPPSPPPAVDPAAAPTTAPSPPSALAADPPAVPAWSEGAPVATAAAISTSTSPTRRQARAGFGVSVTDADGGFASTFQAGVQVDPWSLVGFRASMGMTTSVVGAGGWDAAEWTGTVLFRPLGNELRVVPYLGLGVQFALLAIFPDAPRPPAGTLSMIAAGHLAPMLAGADGGNFPQVADGFGGTNQFKVMPELTAGALVRLTTHLDLDVAARYLPLSWNGSTYSGFSVVASICAPF